MVLIRKHIISLLVAGAVITGILLMQTFQSSDKAFAGTGIGEGMTSTSTPYLASNTVLCGGPATLGSIIGDGAHSGYLWALDATSTTHTDFATTSAIIAERPTGHATSSVEYGVGTKRGLIINYTGTGTTTITYRCGG